MGAEDIGTRGRLAQAILFGCVALAPWPYACAQDKWRYTLAAILLAASALWWSSRTALVRSGVTLPLAAQGLPAVGLLQIALGTSASAIATAEAVLQVTALLAALVSFADIARERSAALRLAAVTLVGAAAQGGFGVVQAALAPRTIYGHAPAIAQSPFGSYVNHNHFAGLIEMAVPLALGWALGLLRRSRGPTPGFIALGGLGLGLAAAHLASRSRGGLVALVGATAFLALLWWIRHRRRERRWVEVLAAGVASVSVLCFAWLAVPSDARRHLMSVASGTSDASASYRLDIAKATLRLAVSRPWLGAGLGAYDDAVPAFKQGHGDLRTTYAESDLLQLLAETGLVGALACVALLVAVLWCARQRLAEHGDPVRRGVALGGLAGAFGLAIHSAIDFNLHMPANALVFVAILGLAAAPLAEQDAEATPFGRSARRALGLCLAGLVIASLCCVWRAWGGWSHEQARRTGPPQQRVAALTSLLRWHPCLADAYRDRARARMILAASGSLPAQRLRAADEDLRAALRLRPFWGEAWADRGWVASLSGNSPQARTMFERALALDPTHQGIRDIAVLLGMVGAQTPAPAPGASLK